MPPFVFLSGGSGESREPFFIVFILRDPSFLAWVFKVERGYARRIASQSRPKAVVESFAMVAQVFAQLDAEENYVICIERNCFYGPFVFLVRVFTVVAQAQIHMLKGGPLWELLVLEPPKKFVSAR